MRLPFLELHRPIELDDGLLFYWACWTGLNPSRQRSMGGPSGIPFSEICRWMDEFGVMGREERDTLIVLVQRMDAYYLQWVSEKLERESEAKGGRSR